MITIEILEHLNQAYLLVDEKREELKNSLLTTIEIANKELSAEIEERKTN